MPEETNLMLEIHKTPGGEVHLMSTGDSSHMGPISFGEKTRGQAWHLEIPPGPSSFYRLAQIDDYGNFQRPRFPWQPPINLNLRARVSASEIPGTWGFGLWNDPFSLSLGFGGGMRRFPVLPNAAWFFFASPQNHLSFRDDKPAQGFLAQSFRSSHIPAGLLAFGALAMPLLLWPRMARKLRPLFRRWIKEDSFAIYETPEVAKTSEVLNPAQWHAYSLEWRVDGVTFRVDDQTCATGITPKAPLGLVLWIDNQFAAFPPDGRLSYGTLENPRSAWLEIENLSIANG